MSDPKEYLLEEYFKLLVRWNRRINLTSVGSWDEFENTHVADARRALPYLAGAESLVDLGTGAGIPGVILKIEQRYLDVTLIDSKRKKISFCNEVIRRLGLAGIRTVWGRAEDSGVAKSAGQFDVAVSCATWSLLDLLKISAPYLHDQSRLIAMRGAGWKREMDEAEAAAREFMYEIKEIDEYSLYDGRRRCLLVYSITI